MSSRLLSAALSVSAFTACASTASTDASTERTATRDASRDGMRKVDDPVVPCALRPDGADAVCVRQVRGRAVDFDGAPLARHVITYCGPACFSGTTDDGGAFVVEVNDFVVTQRYTLQVHGRPAHASAWFASPDPVDGVVAWSEPLAVPRYQDQGPELPTHTDGGTFTAGDVTLTVPMGARLEFDVEDFELGPLGRTLRATHVALDRAPTFARQAGLSMVWALAPFNLVCDRPMGVRVRNRAGLPAGSAVDFVVMGNEIVEAPVTAGRPVVAASGHVSADGATVATDPGVGVSYLTWIGVRPRRESP
jgi:hypothetical protein